MYNLLMTDVLAELATLLNQSKWLAPTNYHDEMRAFLSKDKKNPEFVYPEFPTAELNELISQLEKEPSPTALSTNSTVAEIIRSRRQKELLLLSQLHLAENNETFTKISIELFGLAFLEAYLDSSKEDIDLPFSFASQENTSAEEARTTFLQTLEKYGLEGWTIQIVDTPDFRMRVKSNQKLMLINQETNWEFSDLDGTIAHEIEGHILRAANAHRQKDQLFQKPLPFYIKTEEGLASFLADYCSTSAELNRKYHSLKYYAGYLSLTSDFRTIFELFTSYGFTPENAFQRTFRLKRGLKNLEKPGLFAKEAVYYQGMLEVKKFLDEGGDVHKLYAGKVGLADLHYSPIPENQIIPERLLNYLKKK